MTQTEKQLEKLVSELPSNGEWWHEDGKEPFIEVATKLNDCGYTINEISDLLERLYHAVAEEYGE